MKKIIKNSLIIILCCLTIKVNAKSIWDTTPKELHDQENIAEEITPIRNNKGEITGINVILIIKEEETKEQLVLSPSIFQTISAYKKLNPGDKININMKIINQSNYDYEYVDNSLILSTEDLTRLESKDNFVDTTATGFDGRTIYDIFSPYRTLNSAILFLYNVSNEKELKEEDLMDEKLSKKLQEKGYSGIEELEKYYLDFYNNKYNLQEESLETFTYSTIKEIFSGKRTEIKETNPVMIALSYNYFYNKLLFFTFKDQKASDSNSEQYSIGEYMRKNIGNQYLKEAFQEVKSQKTYELKEMSLHLNKQHAVELYKYYNPLGHFEFILQQKKSSAQSTMQEGTIIPPHTGIEKMVEKRNYYDIMRTQRVGLYESKRIKQKFKINCN